jgi:hypothetical protein
MKQSANPTFRGGTANLAAGQKGGAPASGAFLQIIEIANVYCPAMARSLLKEGARFNEVAGQRNVRSISQRRSRTRRRVRPPEQGSSDNSLPRSSTAIPPASSYRSRTRACWPHRAGPIRHPPPTQGRDANNAPTTHAGRSDDRTTAGQRSDATDDSVAKTRSTKSNDSKSDDANAEQSTASDDAAASDPAKTDPDSPAAATVNAVAAAIPPVATATDAAASTAPASDKATTPLATAAAAIAAASSVTRNASTGTPTASGIDAGVAATPAVAKAAGVKIEPQAAATDDHHLDMPADVTAERHRAGGFRHRANRAENRGNAQRPRL